MNPSVSRSGSPSFSDSEDESESESESEPGSSSELALGDFWSSSSSSSSLGESICGCESSSSLLAMGERWKRVLKSVCVRISFAKGEVLVFFLYRTNTETDIFSDNYDSTLFILFSFHFRPDLELRS